MENLLIPMLGLQVFAEGGDGATGDTAEGQGSESPLAQETAENPLAKEQEAPDLDAEFEALIKDKYKAQYDQRVRATVQKRFKGAKESEEKLQSLNPVLDLLGKKYGADSKDIAGLIKAIEDDDSLYEEEAIKRGMDVSQLKEIKKMERENENLKKAIDERTQQEQAARQYQTWLDQAEEAKKTYPDLDLDVEAENPEFQKLLAAGIDVGSAYLVIHKDDVIPAAMQYTAKEVERKVTNRIIANGQRPAENGLNSQNAVKTTSDVSKLTKAQRDELCRRAARGERITFGK